jgi:hypothetical protein
MGSTKNLGLRFAYSLIVGAVLFVSPLTIIRAEGHQVHWRLTSKRVLQYPGCGPYGALRPRPPARLNARDARIRQLNPRLRGNDGNLGERLSAIRTDSRAIPLDLGGWIGIVGGEPSDEWRRRWRYNRSFRRRR